MTSKHVDQVDQEKSPPTVPAHPLGDPTVAATRGDIWETSTLDGNSRETTATHGSFTRHLAKLAKLMFTHQGPYRDSEGSDPLDPHILGVPPGSNLATSGRSTQHLAAQGNFTRPLERYNKSLPAQGSAYHAIGGNLPYSTEGYLAVTTFGVTKEITANSQDPDQTSRRSRLSCRRVTRGHGEVTMENYHLPHFHHLLTISSRHQLLPHFTTSFLPPYHSSFLPFHHVPTTIFHLTNTYHFYHHLITSLHHIFHSIYLPYSPHSIYSTKSITYIITPTAISIFITPSSSSSIHGFPFDPPTASLLHQGSTESAIIIKPNG